MKFISVEKKFMLPKVEIKKYMKRSKMKQDLCSRCTSKLQYPVDTKYQKIY